jgi:ribosomal protein S18 acetylase RimI-like enzyme
MAIEIKVLQRGDESILMNVAPEVFDNPVDGELTREFLEDPRHHIAVVIDDGLVVGFASGIEYIHPDKPAELWINEVALAPTHRHRGLGKAVLKAVLEVGRARNCAVAWVLTYRNNAAARALYSSVGGTEGADDSGSGDAMLGYSFALMDASGHRPADQDTVWCRRGSPDGPLVQHRFCKFVAAGLRGCVGRSARRAEADIAAPHNPGWQSGRRFLRNIFPLTKESTAWHNA